MAADVHDRDEVPLPGHRVGLAHAFDVGQRAAERRDRAALGLDEHDRVRHALNVSPGWRICTFADVCDSTSDLKAWSLVSIGGNVP